MCAAHDYNNLLPFQILYQFHVMNFQFSWFNLPTVETCNFHFHPFFVCVLLLLCSMIYVLFFCCFVQFLFYSFFLIFFCSLVCLLMFCWFFFFLFVWDFLRSFFRLFLCVFCGVILWFVEFGRVLYVGLFGVFYFIFWSKGCLF